MKLIYLKSALKCDSFDVAIGIKILFFRVLVTIEPSCSLLQFVTTNRLMNLRYIFLVSRQHNNKMLHKFLTLRGLGYMHSQGCLQGGNQDGFSAEDEQNLRRFSTRANNNNFTYLPDVLN